MEEVTAGGVPPEKHRLIGQRFLDQRLQRLDTHAERVDRETVREIRVVWHMTDLELRSAHGYRWPRRAAVVPGQRHRQHRDPEGSHVLRDTDSRGFRIGACQIYRLARTVRRIDELVLVRRAAMDHDHRRADARCRRHQQSPVDVPAELLPGSFRIGVTLDRGLDFRDGESAALPRIGKVPVFALGQRKHESAREIEPARECGEITIQYRLRHLRRAVSRASD